MEANIITEIFLPLAVGIIMLGMGMSLVLDDFKRVLIYPKAVAIGLVNQLVLLPIIAFLLIKLFGLQTELAVGLMILAACPGGATSNLISHLAKGDTALSITLTAISSIFTVFTIPYIVNWALVHFMPNGQELQLNVMHTFLQVVGVILIPVTIGMIIRNYFPQFAFRMEKTVKIISAAFLVIIISAAIIKERENLVESFLLAGPVALTLNFMTLSAGFVMAKLFSLSTRQGGTISIESGIQNGTLGIVIAASIIGNSVMTIPAAIYSLIMFATGFVVIFIGNKTVVD